MNNKSKEEFVNEVKPLLERLNKIIKYKKEILHISSKIRGIIEETFKREEYNQLQDLLDIRFEDLCDIMGW